MTILIPAALAVGLALFAAGCSGAPSQGRHHIRPAAANGCVYGNPGYPSCSTGRRAHQRASNGQSSRSPKIGHYRTVRTAAGIPITAAPGFAAAAAGVIADLVANGYRPRRVSCLSHSGNHVRGSLHFKGAACDVDQRGWGRSMAPRHTLRMIVARHGLRDGCEFGDSGHFDNGPHLNRRRILHNCGRAYLNAIYGSHFTRRGNTR